jgi:hypothetical protein
MALAALLRCHSEVMSGGMNDLYEIAVPEDQVLVDAFEVVYVAKLEELAPLPGVQQAIGEQPGSGGDSGVPRRCQEASQHIHRATSGIFTVSR